MNLDGPGRGLRKLGEQQKAAIIDKWVETGRGRLFVRLWRPKDASEGLEEGVPIILFHDSLGCIQLWRTFPAVLAERTGRPVVAYDRLGFGESDPRTDKLPVNFIAEEAQSALPFIREQLRIDRFIALGHSVGGGMAVNCAAVHASACEALITESAQAFVDDPMRAALRQADEFFHQPEQLERLQRYHGTKTRWVLDAWVRTWLSREFADWSLRDVLPRVACPTLVIHGGQDEYGSNAHAETIAGLVSGPAQLEIMPGTSHVPHREREEWVVKRIADFLDGLQVGGK